jgi:hypothetical protein
MVKIQIPSFLKHTKLWPAQVALAGLFVAGLSIVNPVVGEQNKPIIAHMLAALDVYNGQTVTIYGLVIETEQAGRVFMLQDVSQMPLRIIRADGTVTTIGDQLLVKGVFELGPNGPQLSAHMVKETKVLGGGGCC